ncbi:MAG TPA: response regulator [Gemmatimonadaceae bacterium]|nr:response regulator [Gemmatimonadaceae bacterium]
MTSPVDRDLIPLLLIEDNANDANLFALTLPPSAFRLVTVTTLAGALAAIRADTFALAILDLGLPDASGLNAVIAVRAVAPDLPLIILSTVVSAEVTRQILAAGAQDVLIKGESRTTLQQRLLLIIERHQFEAANRLAHAAETEALEQERRRISGQVDALKGQLGASHPAVQVQAVDPSVPATTTFQQDLTTAGQRQVNLIWERTQSVIALMVVITTMGAGAYGMVRNLQIPTLMAVAFGTVVGFYFSRTNHAAIGGVGPQPQEKYTGR